MTNLPLTWDAQYESAIEDGNYDFASEILGDVDLTVKRTIEKNGYELDRAAESLEGLFNAADDLPERF